MRYTDAELDALLNDLESDYAERKSTWDGSAPEKSRQAICAFANDLPGHRRFGVLFVGAKDDGTPQRLTVDEQLLQTLAAIKTDGKIIPPPSMMVEKRILKGAEMAVVTIMPSNAPPVRYDGRVWVRTGPRRALATAQEEHLLAERRRHRDLPFDVHSMPSTSVSDLNVRMFEEEYLPHAVAPDILAANGRTRVEQLASCRMVLAPDEPTPTVLGLLTLGIRPRDWLPGAFVQFLRFAGTDLSSPVADEAVVDGPLAEMLRKLDEKLDSHNRTAIDLTSGVLERRRSDYPSAALRQLTRNAVMHRTYEGTYMPVKIHWFDNRIEIISPGGPFGTCTVENFGKPGITDYRNPHVAEAMKILGYVQRFGVGIATAKKEMELNGNPPLEFQVESTVILIVLHRKP